MIPVPVDIPVANGRTETISRRFVQWLRDAMLPRLAERLRPTTVQTADYTAQPWDLIRCDPSGGPLTHTLPENPKDGDECAYVNTTADATAVTMAAPGNFTVMGATTFDVTGAQVSALFVFSAEDGDWVVL